MKRLAFAALGPSSCRAFWEHYGFSSSASLVSTAHAMVGQTFFWHAVTIALFSGQRWIEEHPRLRWIRINPA